MDDTDSITHRWTRKHVRGLGATSLGHPGSAAAASARTRGLCESVRSCSSDIHRGMIFLELTASLTSMDAVCRKAINRSKKLQRQQHFWSFDMVGQTISIRFFIAWTCGRVVKALDSGSVNLNWNFLV